jgi:hypothetical protein
VSKFYKFSSLAQPQSKCLLVLTPYLGLKKDLYLYKYTYLDLVTYVVSLLLSGKNALLVIAQFF